MVETDKIKVKTTGKSIDVADPLRNLEVVVNYGQVKWDADQGVFYRLKDNTITDDQEFYKWTEFTKLSDGAQNNIKTYFNWSGKAGCYTLFYFYRMTNCHISLM